MWISHLSNNKSFKSDDNPTQNWLSLKDFIENSSVYIKSIDFEFNNTTIQVADYADAYTFSYAIEALFPTGQYAHKWVIGVKRADLLKLHYYYIPSLEYSHLYIKPFSKISEVNLIHNEKKI